ncbi:hypothetical protein EJ05DRAFT_500388 [Pseudovirgaria hyperparasitica]|uniref:Uncharacterized protein n=1 Tax=Pseudovirgaria hyperparasitica TaxID=470096 RepID=A0A6A6W7C5_9PEZI|nr:uncharacterized protein EJ05DRAFT_500388 [Pseudovirgaria hyperparasitica]KAF2757860.1 hypothetical protein EJ05DRAFT_500388 [Pseudovirgaria hyperparasitica]
MCHCHMNHLPNHLSTVSIIITRPKHPSASQATIQPNPSTSLYETQQIPNPAPSASQFTENKAPFLSKKAMSKIKENLGKILTLKKAPSDECTRRLLGEREPEPLSSVSKSSSESLYPTQKELARHDRWTETHTPAGHLNAVSDAFGAAGKQTPNRGDTTRRDNSSMQEDPFADPVGGGAGYTTEKRHTTPGRNHAGR